MNDEIRIGKVTFRRAPAESLVSDAEYAALHCDDCVRLRGELDTLRNAAHEVKRLVQLEAPWESPGNVAMSRMAVLELLEGVSDEG